MKAYLTSNLLQVTIVTRTSSYKGTSKLSSEIDVNIHNEMLYALV